VRWQREAQDVLGTDQVAGVLLRAGEDRLLVMGPARDPTTFTLGTQVCPYQRESSGNWVRTSEGCQSLDGIVVGHEDSVLWTVVTTFGASGQVEQLHRLEVKNGWPAETDTLALSTQFRVARGPLGGGAITPFILNGFVGPIQPVALPRWDAVNKELGLELLPDLPAGNPGMGASSRYVWGPSPIEAFKTWVYARASTP
jgi:hypothetical protein